MENREQTLQLQAIVQRLERLERANRRWKRLAVLGLALVGILPLLGAGKHDEPAVANEIQARAFVLVDREGTPLARLGLLPHGVWGLGFYDQGKKSRLMLSIDHQGASTLSLLSKDGKGGLLLSASGNGSTSVRFVDTQWKTRATLATWPDGSPFLQLADREGKERALLQYTDVAATATGTLIKRPGPSLLFFNQDDTLLWQAP
ncbi:MAG: hypothetical protein AB7N91_00240 [Candidatus Tectimicrobiota bacterium]